MIFHNVRVIGRVYESLRETIPLVQAIKKEERARALEDQEET